MKIVASLQIILGLAAGYAAWWLAAYKKSVPNIDGIIVPRPPPNYTYEVGLIIIGLLIFCLALAQFAKHKKLAILQLIFGQDILILSAVLYSSAMFDAYQYNLGVYWLVFVLMAVALFVVVTGLIQLLKEKA